MARTDPRLLEDFLREPPEVDDRLFAAFCRYLRETSQINGSFYKRLPGATTATGLKSGAERVTGGRIGVRPIRA